MQERGGDGHERAAGTAPMTRWRSTRPPVFPISVMATPKEDWEQDADEDRGRVMCAPPGIRGPISRPGLFALNGAGAPPPLQL